MIQSIITMLHSILLKITKNDYVIICGYFGGIWTFEEERIYEYRKREAYFRIRDLFGIFLLRWIFSLSTLLKEIF